MLEKKVDWQKNLIISGLLLIGLFILYKVRAIFLPLVLSITLAYILNPLVKYFERKIPRWLSILSSYLILTIILTLIIIFVANPLSAQLNKLNNNLPKYIENLQRQFKNAQASYLKYRIPDSLNEVINKEFKNIGSLILEKVRRGVLGTFKLLSFIIELILVPILTFYFLLDKEKIKEGLISPFPSIHQEKAKKILEEISSILDRYVRGQLILCAIMAFVSTIIFSFLHLEFALILGLFAGITKAIPLLGPIIGAIPCTLIALLKSVKVAIWVIIFFSLVQFLENKIILPKVMEYYVHLHPVTIIIALLIGDELGGVLGMFVAVPIFAVLKIFYNHFYLKLEV